QLDLETRRREPLDAGDLAVPPEGQLQPAHHQFRAPPQPMPPREIPYGQDPGCDATVNQGRLPHTRKLGCGWTDSRCSLHRRLVEHVDLGGPTRLDLVPLEALLDPAAQLAAYRVLL